MARLERVLSLHCCPQTGLKNAMECARLLLYHGWHRYGSRTFRCATDASLHAWHMRLFLQDGNDIQVHLPFEIRKRKNPGCW
jgi:hypothetical protein